MHIKQKLPQENIQNISLQLDGQDICAKGTIKINGIEMSDGISGVELKLPANNNPEITIEYHPRRIDKETAESLGLEKHDSK